MRTLHLFAGAGGGLLADLILGHTPVAAVEWDAYCCQVLRERAEEGWFPGLRVHEGDVRLFDPSEYAGRVDCIHAGFPCQDISVAGRGAGVGADTRSGLYREVLRIADVVRPRYLFLENVAAILGNGLGTVLGDLVARGYDTRWTCVSAAVAGAPHQRDRWWLMGHAKCDADGSICVRERNVGRNSVVSTRWNEEADKPSGPSEDVADSKRIRSQGPWKFVNASGSAASSNWEAVGSEHGSGPKFWSTEPDVGRVANGVASRVDRLKALGNGQVPLQAALAWRILTSTMET